MALTDEERKAKEKELAEVIALLEKLRDEEKLRFYCPTPKQIECHLNLKRCKYFLAGNRCGKTVAGAVLVTLLALGKRADRYLNDWKPLILDEFTRLSKEAPGENLRREYAKMANTGYVEELVEDYRKLAHSAPKNARIWVCSETYEVQRDVVQKELVGDADTLTGGWIPTNEIKGKPTYRHSKVIDILKLKSGATIGFKSYDQGRRKFQGTSQHLIWFDEEPPEDIRDECRMRLMDVKGIEIGTMTPLSGLTHIYDDVYLNDTKPPEKKDPEVFCLTAGWDDNPYLSEDEKKRLEANMDPNDIEARKYGRFVMPGKCCFDGKAVQEGIEKSYPGERGNLTWNAGKVEWQPEENGDYEVWFHPEKGCEYLVPADVAEGLEHGDYDAVGVLNRSRGGRLEAVYHGHVDPDVLSDYIHKMAVYYNNALTAPELNNHGAVTISHLKIVYSDIYRSMVYDKIADEEREKLGWLTSPKTRPYVVDAVKKAIRERTFECYWRRFWDEAMNFVRHPSGKEAARQGYWDDAVLMAGIGLHIHNTTTLTGDLPPPSAGGRSSGLKAGWQKDKDGREIFIHPSRIEDMRRQEWGAGWED